MKLGETIIRLLGGAALGAVIGITLTAAPLELARILTSVLGLALLIWLGFFLFGLEQKRRLTVMAIVAVLAFLILLNQTIAQAVWQGVRFLADALARLLLATRGQSTSETIITWIILGMAANLLFGAIDLDAWRRVNR